MSLSLAAVVLAASSVVSSPDLESVGYRVSYTPVTVNDLAESVLFDEDANRIIEMMTGTFVASSMEAGAEVQLQYNAAPYDVEGLENTMYFEVHRVDDPSYPFKQGILEVFRRQGDLRMRVYGFTGQPEKHRIHNVMVGAYLKPEAFPELKLSQLDPNLDIAIEKSGTGFSGATEFPYPTIVGGAREMTSSVQISADSLTFDDRGFNDAGDLVWGTEGGYTFRPAESQAVVEEQDSGLVIIDLKPAGDDSVRLQTGGTVAVQYSGWLTDGSLFDSSRAEGRTPFQLRVPGGVIQGWNDGLLGVGMGAQRRLIIPYQLAYGERGRPPQIPPASTLIFEVEPVSIQNADAAPAGAGGEGGGGE